MFKYGLFSGDIGDSTVRVQYEDTVFVQLIDTNGECDVNILTALLSSLSCRLFV